MVNINQDIRKNINRNINRNISKNINSQKRIIVFLTVLAISSTISRSSTAQTNYSNVVTNTRNYSVRPLLTLPSKGLGQERVVIPISTPIK